MKVLETERLYLRKLCPEDKAELSKVLSDPKSMQYYPHPFSEEEVERWINWNIDNYEKYGHGLWAVIRKEDDAFLGDCGITMQNIGDNEIVPEIGFHILPEYCRHGYASEAAIACRDYGFNVLGYKRLYSYTITRNIPSQGVAKKMGMHEYKRFRKYDEDQIAQCIDRP